MWCVFIEKVKDDETLRTTTYHQYRRVFVTKCNLGFSSPKTDICSTCEKFRVEIADCQDDSVKRQKMQQFEFHRRQADEFYRRINEAIDNQTAVIAFDMMQNLPFPNSGVGEVYWSRQLYQYILAFVHHTGKQSSQSKENVHIYTWGEYQGGKGPDEITSALVDYIRGFKERNPDVKRIKLFCDSCAAQNKSYVLLAVLSKLAEECGIQFELNYPVRGHSFLPPDRVFGRLEQIVRKQKKIITPDEYFVLKVDWHIYNFKEVFSNYIKSKKGFKISESRVVHVKKNGVIGNRVTFSGLNSYNDIFKPTSNHSCLQLTNFQTPIDYHQPIKKDKIDDTKYLLSRIGVTEVHSKMSFFRNIFSYEYCDE